MAMTYIDLDITSQAWIATLTLNNLEQWMIQNNFYPRTKWLHRLAYNSTCYLIYMWRIWLKRLLEAYWLLDIKNTIRYKNFYSRWVEKCNEKKCGQFYIDFMHEALNT